MTTTSERKPPKRRTPQQAYEDWINEGHRVAQEFRRKGEIAVADALSEKLVGELKALHKHNENPTIEGT